MSVVVTSTSPSPFRSIPFVPTTTLSAPFVPTYWSAIGNGWFGGNGSIPGTTATRISISLFPLASALLPGASGPPWRSTIT